MREIPRIVGQEAGLQSTNNFIIMVKVKVKFTLEQATKAQRGSIGIAVLFL